MKNHVTRGGLRPAVVLFAVLVLLSLAIAHQAHGQAAQQFVTHVLPYANEHGYRTSLRVTNPTAEVILLSVYGKAGPELTVPIAPHTTYVEDNWPKAGVNVREIVADARLVPGVEIETPLGTITRSGPLKPVTYADFYDLPPTGTFESHVFVAVLDDTSGWVNVSNVVTAPIDPETNKPAWSALNNVTDKSAILLPVKAGRSEVSLGYSVVAPNLPGPPSIYTFAIVVHDATGAITVQAPAAATPFVPPEAPQ
ncbi:MAG TPA: hypothetical protein VF787_26610 [Thermoanaerobaculia bacterium]